MAKAYDKVEWSVIDWVLQLHGFGDDFCQNIRECISSVSYSILVNGSPCGFFKASRGIRQGDPISPALFTLISDILSQLLIQAEAACKIHGVKISRTSPRITHLMYDDDLVIYGHATLEEATEIFRCLTTYCQDRPDHQLGQEQCAFQS